MSPLTLLSHLSPHSHPPRKVQRPSSLHHHHFSSGACVCVWGGGECPPSLSPSSFPSPPHLFLPPPLRKVQDNLFSPPSPQYCSLGFFCVGKGKDFSLPPHSPPLISSLPTSSQVSPLPTSCHPPQKLKRISTCFTTTTRTVYLGCLCEGGNVGPPHLIIPPQAFPPPPQLLFGVLFLCGRGECGEGVSC